MQPDVYFPQNVEELAGLPRKSGRNASQTGGFEPLSIMGAKCRLCDELNQLLTFWQVGDQPHATQPEIMRHAPILPILRVFL